MNGIAYWEENSQFLLTGKLWPNSYVVTLDGLHTTGVAGAGNAARGDARSLNDKAHYPTPSSGTDEASRFVDRELSSGDDSSSNTGKVDMYVG